jgi:lipoprotein-anchoring transpeptidase ErfK/SrfK
LLKAVIPVMQATADKYDEVVARAVASLPRDAVERQAAYDRARAVLMSRLLGRKPALPAAVIEAEQASLEAAIRRIEMEFAGPGAVPAEPMTQPGFAPPRSGLSIRTFVLCCASVAVAAIVGLIYAYTEASHKSGDEQPRQKIAQPAERASTEQNLAGKPEADAPAFIYKRQLVYYRSPYPAGTVVIDKSQRYLYVLLANVAAVRYGIALGSSCAEAVGRYVIARKLGPSGSQQTSASGNASGRQALYFDTDAHRIHDTDLARSIGGAVRNGCFQLIERDFAELYGRVPVGTRVVVN